MSETGRIDQEIAARREEIAVLEKARDIMGGHQISQAPLPGRDDGGEAEAICRTKSKDGDICGTHKATDCSGEVFVEICDLCAERFARCEEHGGRRVAGITRSRHRRKAHPTDD